VAVERGPLVPGTTADAHDFTSRDVNLLVEALKALHQPAPDDAPRSVYRGVAQAELESRMDARLARLSLSMATLAMQCEEIWAVASAADESTERLWLHGDLHPRNVVIREGALVGIIDWGDVTSGDVATDLACTWLLIEDPLRRREMLDAYGADQALRSRAMGWAVYIGLALEMSGEEQHVPLGSAAIRRVIDDFSGSL
jgi:aminoglycoside phosphotransferase (APT) family kinase protein